MPPKFQRQTKDESFNQFVNSDKKGSVVISILVKTSKEYTGSQAPGKFHDFNPSCISYPEGADYVDCYVNDKLIWEGKPSSTFCRTGDEFDLIKDCKVFYYKSYEYVDTGISIPVDVRTEKTFTGIKIVNDSSPPANIKIIFYYGGYEIETITKTVKTTFEKKYSKSDSHFSTKHSISLEFEMSSKGYRNKKKLNLA